MSTGRSTDLASAIAQAMGGGEAPEAELQTLPWHTPPAPEGGWSTIEKAKLRIGDRYRLTWQEALSLEGEDEADWRDQAERLLQERTRNRLEKALEDRFPPKGRGSGDTGEEGADTEEGGATRPEGGLHSGSGSYGIGNDDALTRDLESKLGIRRHLGRGRV